MRNMKGEIMKKKLALLLALCMVLTGCLCACGGSDAPAGNDTEAAASGDVAAPSVGGETVDVGSFTVIAPDGWMKIPQTDIWGETDSEGNYPLDPTSYALCKGGESEWDAFSKPTLYIYYHDENGAADQAESSLWFYDSSEAIDVTIGGTKCAAYQVESSPLTEGDPNDVYQIVCIPVTDGSCFQINIPFAVNGFDGGLKWDDADVLAILESLKVK